MMLQNEYAKMRHTRMLPLALAVTLAIVAFSSMNLVSEHTAEQFQQDPHSQWGGYLLGYITVTAFLTPVQVALLASRAADVEHLHGGWRLNSIAGYRRGGLLRAEFAALALVLAAVKVVELLAVLTNPFLFGAQSIDSPGTWVLTAAGLYGTSCALMAIFLWQAARVESQLVVLSTGVVGGFLGVAGMLSPTAVTLINPFGYYAVLSPFTFRPEGLVSIEPLWIPWVLFIAVVTVIFTVLCRTLDSQEE